MASDDDAQPQQDSVRALWMLQVSESSQGRLSFGYCMSGMRQTERSNIVTPNSISHQI